MRLGRRNPPVIVIMAVATSAETAQRDAGEERKDERRAPEFVDEEKSLRSRSPQDRMIRGRAIQVERHHNDTQTGPVRGDRRLLAAAVLLRGARQ